MSSTVLGEPSDIGTRDIHRVPPSCEGCVLVAAINIFLQKIRQKIGVRNHQSSLGLRTLGLMKVKVSEFLARG